jgi:hypothetical protein
MSLSACILHRHNQRLDVKQEKSAHAYLECGNASEAYRKAYDCKKDEQ